MSPSRGRGGIRRPAALVFLLALAVMLMHTVIAGPAGTSSDGAVHHVPVHDEEPAAPSGTGGTPQVSHALSATAAPPVMTADAPVMTGDDDCGDHIHGCVFIRVAETDRPAAVLVLLVWVFPSVPLVPRRTHHVVVRLGRPPPWAVHTHLQLQVIRC
ncbi:hypothetical protein [Gordonia aurantiaca]|uniref:hypothetical protein n=1 Tax=Gordonia sp. B21 TaxID=3151852 RepID=UPI003267DFDA